jgi:hypothetical protein
LTVAAAHVDADMLHGLNSSSVCSMGSLRIPHACGAIPSSARSASFDSLMRQMIFH